MILTVISIIKSFGYANKVAEVLLNNVIVNDFFR